MASGELLRLRLPCDAAAPRRARQAVANLPDIEPVRDDALLVVSELATNAVRHSGCSPADEFEVVAERTPRGVRIAVTDAGISQQVPTRRDADPLRPGGMGLQVVEAVARCWGSERDGSLSVWAELAV